MSLFGNNDWLTLPFNLGDTEDLTILSVTDDEIVVQSNSAITPLSTIGNVYKNYRHISYAFTVNSLDDMVALRSFFLRYRNNPFAIDNYLAYLRSTDNNNRFLSNPPNALTIVLDFDCIPNQ